MNPTDTLTTLFRHNRWANVRILERCAGLTDEQLDATIVGTYGSIRDTLQHIVTAERSYFSRISTGQPYRRPRRCAAIDPGGNDGIGAYERLWPDRVGAQGAGRRHGTSRLGGRPA